MERIECTWWEHTGRMTPFKGEVSSPIMRALQGGREVSFGDLPVGALWTYERQASRQYKVPTGRDGLSVMCRLPDGATWHIDGRAANCTLKEEKTHRCWVRHGTVGEAITVDKAGETCAAGSGSIQTAGYHGFLRRGFLERC